MADPKPEIRIACVGDSVTFGWGVSYEESYPARLERLLIERGRSVEVLNAGVPAMKPGTIWKWAVDQFSVWNPDLILVARRPDYSGQKSEELAIEELVTAVRAIAVPAGDKGVRVALILPPVSTFDIRGSPGLPKGSPSIGMLWRPMHPVMDLTEAFRTEAKALNTGVRLQVQGSVQKMFQAPGNQMLLEVDAGEQLAEEIIAEFEANPNMYETLFFDAGHPTSDGLKLFAEEVESFLIAEGLVRAQ